MIQRLFQNWVYGGVLAGVLLVLLMPALCVDWSLAVVAVFLQLPVYMLHQYEEHDDDRFRRFFNRTIGGGREVLSPAAVFVINVPGVWGVIGVSFLLAKMASLGFGLMAVYLTLVNAVVHVIATLGSRAYNPGLVTAILLFLPSSVFGLWAFNHAGGVGWGSHVLGLGVGIGIHAVIMVYVRLQRAARG